MNQLDLKGRHAVITGGAAGIGYAITQRLLASGARVTWWDRDAAAMSFAAAQLGAGLEQVAQVVVDVADHASVVAALQQTTAGNPVIDILVNCAGITGPKDRKSVV